MCFVCFNVNVFFWLFLFEEGKVAFLAVSEKFRRLATLYPCLCQLFAEIMEKRTPYLWNITSLLSMTFQRRDSKSEPPQSSSIGHHYEIGFFFAFCRAEVRVCCRKKARITSFAENCFIFGFEDLLYHVSY